MVEVEMTKDIHDYEPKLLGLVTTRQLICLVIGAAYTLPTLMSIPVSDISMLAIIGVVMLMPMIAVGWIKIYGMNMEAFVVTALEPLLLCPTNRKYETQNSTEWLTKEFESTKQKKKIKPSKEYIARK